MEYGLIVKPNYNIAFFDTYLEMCEIELNVVLYRLGLEILDLSIHKINKSTMITFEVDQSLNHEQQVAVYRLSFFYSLMQVVEGGLYKPVQIQYTPDFEDDLSTRLKYNGKTNETITRMMMNLAIASTKGINDEVINIMDPLCGRGTTLFEAMISGYNAYGVDRDQKSVAELGTYITRYIKDARFKHTNKHGKLIVGGKNVGELFEMVYAKDKIDYKKNQTNELKVLKGDTTRIEGAFRHKMMHAIVTDFPYNVQHKAKTSGPIEEGLTSLLSDGLTSWTPFLKKGGTIALSWNLYTDKREHFEEIFESFGYEVLKNHGLDRLKHRVSQGITRDIIIALKL